MASLHSLDALTKKGKKKEIEQLKEYDLSTGKDLGEGSYGKVKTATHKKTQQEVAIKFVEKHKLIKQNDDLRMKREMNFILNLNHPNILKAFEITEDPENYYIVMEKPTEGDLFNYVCKKNRLSLPEATYFFYQIVNGISYLHKNKIVHRDMKPENILITSDQIVKIGDFGFANNFKDKNVKMSTSCGSPVYSSPEMLRGIKYLPEPVDVWGLGIMLYVMAFGALPFDDPDGNEENIMLKITNCDYSFPHHVDPNIKNLISRIFLPNPSDRLTLEQIKEHNVYHIGRTNFLKKFKIYDEDGTVLPQVEAYIKRKTLNFLSSECAIETNAGTERTTPYKIVALSYLHSIQWNQYYINVSKDTKEAKEQAKNDEMSVASSEAEKTMKGRKDSANMETTKRRSFSTLGKKDDAISLLNIGKHESLCSYLGKNEAGTSSEPKNEKIEKKRIHDSIIKLGIINHSFDRHHFAEQAIKAKIEEEQANSIYGMNPRSNQEAVDFVKNVLQKYSPKSLVEDKNIAETIVARVKYIKCREYSDIDFIRDFVDPETKKYNFIFISKKEFEKVFINDKTRNYFISGNKVPWKY